MSAPKCVCAFLAGLLLLSGVARSEEATEPPAVAKFTEKKFSNEKYTAALLGKVSFRRGKKPLETREPVKVTFVKTDDKSAAVPVEVKDGEGFVLQAMPGAWKLQEVERAGRIYEIGQPFNVREGNVIFIGLVDVVLGDEDRSGYEYEYVLDTAVGMRLFNRNPEIGRLVNSYCPASLFSGDNISLFAPTYPIPSAKSKGVKSLGTAAEHGDLATVRELLQAGSDPNALDKDGWTPLQSALRFGHREIAELLLDRGASPDIANPEGWSPLMTALRYDQEALATRMIEKGAEVNRKANDGWTPLMLAVRNKQPGNARRLVEKGAKVEERNKNGTTALMLAAGFAPLEVVELLLGKGADVMARDSDGWTPLMWALHYGSSPVARRLVDLGADIQTPDNEGWTPLMYALRYAHEDVALALLEKGARVNERNKSGWSPLHFALRNGATQAGRKLIEAGADRERPTSDGFTPLMLALRNDQGENARLLIEKGVDLDTRNQDGWTPLMMALRYEQAECARLLAQKCKRIDDKDKDGWTALMFALRYGHSEVANALIQRGASFSYKVEGGWEPLLTALRNNQAENARRLILKGANVNARTEQGWTALMFAIEYDQPENAKLLLEKKADASVTNADGGTALSLARKKGHYELTQLLGGDEAPPSAFAAKTSDVIMPTTIAKAVPIPAGTTVVSAGDCTPGLNGVAHCTVTVDLAGTRVEVYDKLAGSMKGAGWTLEQGTHASADDGTAQGRSEWGFLGLKKKDADGLSAVVITFPSGARPAAGRTRADLTWQRFPNELKRVTYSQVVATYPPDAKKCGTWIDVTGVSPTGQWQTLGVVDYVKFKPQFQCLGTKVTLKVPAAVGGIQYDKETMLTVDKDLKWIEVKSWN